MYDSLSAAETGAAQAPQAEDVQLRISWPLPVCRSVSLNQTRQGHVAECQDWAKALYLQGCGHTP